MNYDEMSDFEINKAVAKHQGLVISKTNDCGSEVVVRNTDYTSWHSVDYCNSWADAGPIIEERGIELSPLFSGEWRASEVSQYTFEEEPIYSISAVHKSVLRAAMIIFSKDEGARE